jgi:hypothetical protein
MRTFAEMVRDRPARYVARQFLARPANSLPFSRVMLRGPAPRSLIARVSAAATLGPLIERSPSSPTHSRVN